MTDGWDEREVVDLADEYELLGEIGRGASAVVYRARDRVLGRLVAIKVVRPHSIASADDAMQRLAREARTVARLHHPNIVTVHAVKRLSSGGLALVMQLVPGRTLKETLATDGPMTPERVERVLRDVAEALAYANIHGVVHRDVKPENIFLDAESGRAMLSDFGIAFSVEHESRLTVTGATIGTPAYMAPEQIDGAPANARSDLYSLGVVAWEMLSGQRPWAGQSLFSVILKQKTEELPPIDVLRPDEVPERVQYLIERMLQKRPGARFAGAEGLIARLDRWTEPPDWPQWQAAVRRRRERLAAGLPLQVVPAAPADPAEAATVVFRRDGEADSDDEGAGVSAYSVARLMVTAPARSARSAVLDLDEQLPSWVVEAPDSAAPARRRALFVTLGAAGMLLAASALIYGGWARQQGTNASGAGEGRAAVALATSAVPPAVETPVLRDDPAPQAVPLEAGPVASSTSSGALAPSGSSAATDAGGAAARPAAAGAPAGRSGSAHAVAAGRGHSCAIRRGALFCWGANDFGQLGAGVSASGSRTPLRSFGAGLFTVVTAGAAHGCALSVDGSIYCWGANDKGQLGRSDAGRESRPVRVADVPRLVALQAGAEHTCGLTEEAQVVCWGANEHGQLGTGGVGSAPAALEMTESVSFVAVAAGARHSCALATDGTVWCWGANRDGQLGDGTRVDQRVPRRVVASERFVAVAAGGAHSCAVSDAGDVWCWGSNDFGQLGLGGRRALATPGRVVGGVRVQTVSLGGAHSCALTAAGEAWCWGNNASAQLGDGSVVTRDHPVRVSGGPFLALSAAFAHSCGVLVDGTVTCWGSNARLQLGDGRRAPIARPVAVAIP
jgi:tRNA A-37 threonylcarbamoyl transferase component Bud32